MMGLDKQIIRTVARCIVLLAPAGLMLVGCDESLPPREALAQFLEPSVRSDTSYVDIKVVNVSVTIRQDINITGAVRNLTDEVLSDDADVRLTATLRDVEDPKRSIVLNGGPANLTGLVQVRNGTVTLEPRYSANFFLKWRTQRWTNGEDVFHDWRLRVTPVFDANHRYLLYFLMPPILIDVTLTAQLFKNTSPMTVKGQIVVLYRIFLTEN